MSKVENASETKPRIAWYRSPVQTEVLRQLSRRSDWRGWVQALAHVLLLLATGAATYAAFLAGHYWLALALLHIHGGCYVFLGFAGAGHELIHRTVFKSRRLNDVFLGLFSFLTWNNWAYFQASHIRHHQYTVHAAHDGEVVLPQKVRLRDWLWACTFNLPGFWRAFRIVAENSVDIIKGKWGGGLFPASQPEDRRKVVNCARVILGGHVLLAGLFLASGCWPLIFLVTLAPFIGSLPNRLLAQAQHAGMQPNTHDFRLNTRTVLLHPLLAFLYWQMNYHVEHHMYPGVPFYQLRHLRQHIEQDLPPAPRGLVPVVRLLLATREGARATSLGAAAELKR